MAYAGLDKDGYCFTVQTFACPDAVENIDIGDFDPKYVGMTYSGGEWTKEADEELSIEEMALEAYVNSEYAVALLETLK